MEQMKNWSVDVKFLKKNPVAFRLWKTEQLINFGLGDTKLNEKYIRENFDKLSIDSEKKYYLSFLLWGKTSF